jgi:hypothetical protein
MMKILGIAMPAKIDPDLLNELLDLGDRLSEDRLYEVVVQEIEVNDFDAVAKARALEEAEGDGNKARAFYTKHRVRRIRDILAQQAFVAEQEAQRKKAKLTVEAERIEAEIKAIKECGKTKFELRIERLKAKFSTKG